MVRSGAARITALDTLVEGVVGAAYEVSNVLGAEFLEKVYQRALAHELALRGLAVRTQVPFPVAYKGQTVGDYAADLLVENQLIVELKCADTLSNDHLAQCINYLKAARLRLALLIDFQKPKVEWRRVVYGWENSATDGWATNEHK
jgi:GxxExxY protein